MKKFFKMLALVLALTLVIGTVPVSAATEVTLKKATKILFVGGCTGAKSTGKKAPYYSYAKLAKLLNNFDSETMKVRATSDNTAVVKTSTTRITAVATGTANITLKVYKGTVKTKNLINTFTVKVTVKKNAAASDLTCKGITDGASFEVGDVVTVSLPKGTDTDKRRLTCSSADVTIKSAGTNKWKVTFNKAGSFKLLAETYQSSTYKKATQSKTINVTVKAPEVKEEIKPIAAKQTALDEFTIENVDKDLEKDDINLYTLIGSTQSPKSYLVNTVKVADGIATVKMFSNLEAGSTYYVEIGSSKTSFAATSGKLEDVKTIKVNNGKAKVGVPTEITCAFYTAGGIDITEGIKSELSASNLKYEMIDASGKIIDYSISAFLSDNMITFNNANEQMIIKVTLTTGYNPSTYEPIVYSATGVMTSYEDAATGDCLYTFTKDDGIYMNEKEDRNLWFAVGEDVCVEALFKYSDGSYKTFAQMGVTSIKIPDQTVVMQQGASLSGGYKLHANNTGKTQIIVYKGETVIGAIPVEVREARKADHFVVKAPASLFLNTNALVSDALVFTAQAYDQYNEVIPGATFSAVQAPQTITSTGTVNGLAFFGNVLMINGYDVVLNTNPATGVIINITCNEIANCAPKPFTIYVKDVPSTAETTPVISVEGDTVIDTTLTIGTQTLEPTNVVLEHRSASFFVTEDIGRYFATRPTAQLKNTDFGVPDGTIVYGYTIDHNGKAVAPAAGSTIESAPGAITFNPVAGGSKLEKGNYVVTFFKIVAGTAYSTVTPIGSKQLTVVDNEPEILVVKKADGLTASLPTELNKFFNFYCDGTDIGDKITSADYQINGDGTSAYIRTVTFTLPNTAVGSFNATVRVDTLISLK